MRSLLLLAAVSLSGCATVVTERYQLGQPERLSEASLEAAHRLGWATERLEGGKFRLLEQRFVRQPEIEVTPGADGVLTLSGTTTARGWDSRPTLGPVGPLLSQATLQVMGLEAKGPPVPTRSVAVTAALDLLLPTAGALYALPGNPFGYSHWGIHVAVRTGLDAVAALFLANAIDYRRSGVGTGTFELGLAIGYLVVNRMLALLMDTQLVQMGNVASSNGLWLDPSAGPERLE